jgi:hypothetical protein
VTIGRVICSSAQVVSGVSAGRFEGGGRRANCASIVGPLPAIQRSRLSFSGRSRRADEPTPEGLAGEGALGASSQLLELLARVAPRLLGQQALEGVLEGPLALVKLGLRPALGNRLQHAAGGVADDPLGPSRQRGQKCAPVGRVGGREGLGARKPRPAGHIADRAEDVEGDPAGRDPPTGGVQRPDAERQVIEQERALSRPGARAMGLEDDRRKELNPVCDQLAAV